MDRIFAPDFVHVLTQGFISGQEEFAFRKKHGFGPADVKRSFEELRVRIYGRTAIANGVVLAREPEKGAEQRTRFTDVFVFRQGRWRAVNAQETPVPESNPAAP